jgi:hypothetical protein
MHQDGFKKIFVDSQIALVMNGDCKRILVVNHVATEIFWSLQCE